MIATSDKRQTKDIRKRRDKTIKKDKDTRQRHKTKTTAPAPLDPFKDLLNMASLLAKKATAGTLDTGYTVTEIKLTLPPDNCGVPGGDGTTCVDFCNKTRQGQQQKTIQDKDKTRRKTRHKTRQDTETRDKIR